MKSNQPMSELRNVSYANLTLMKQGSNLSQRGRGNKIPVMWTLRNFHTNACMSLKKFRTQTIQWWRLLSSPAKSHEFLSVELSRAWEPGDRERAWGFNPGKKFVCRVHCRDKDGWSKAKRNKTQVKVWSYVLSSSDSQRGRIGFFFGRGQWICEWRHLQKITSTVSLGEAVKEHGGLLASMVSQSRTNDTNRGLYFAS